MFWELLHQAWFGIVYLLIKTTITAATQEAQCNTPLGMEDGRIKDSQIKAKSWLYFDRRDSRYYRPHFARLNYDQLSGGWCSADFDKRPDQYIEVDLLRNTLLTAISTQGRHNGQEWVQKFKVEYLRTKEVKFRKFEEKSSWKVFRGNSDTNSTVKQTFSRPIVLRKIRIIPLGNQFTIYCMRLELYGCEWKPARDGLISYSAPLGGLLKRTSLQDNTYDGFVPENPSELVFGGLGKLTDGVIGSEWLIDYSDNSVNAPWVAYTRDPVIFFIFSSKRKFKSISLHVINRNKSIRLFKKLDIEVSEDGMNYKKIARYTPSRKEKEHLGPLAVRVPLNLQTGTYLRCSFELKGVLMLVSEAEFDTETAQLDTTTSKFTQRPSENFVQTNGVDKQLKEKDNSFLAAENNDRTSNDGLSFPIILTIVLVATVLLAALITVLVRYLRSSRKIRLKQRRRKCESNSKSLSKVGEEEEKMTFNEDALQYQEDLTT